MAQCLQSVCDAVQDLDSEVLVVDNGSTEDSAAMVRERFPQVQLNLDCRDKFGWRSDVGVRQQLRNLEEKLKAEDEGRILIRPSGTEPKVRVMVESMSQDIAYAYAEKAIKVLREFTRKQEAGGGGE